MKRMTVAALVLSLAGASVAMADGHHERDDDHEGNRGGRDWSAQHRDRDDRDRDRDRDRGEPVRDARHRCDPSQPMVLGSVLAGVERRRSTLAATMRG